MNYASSTYNNNNTEYSTELNLSVDKNIIQYGNNYIVVDNISSVSVSQLLRRDVDPLKCFFGIFLLLSFVIMLLFDLAFLAFIAVIVGIILLVTSIKTTTLHYLVISLNNGRNVCFSSTYLEFMQKALRMIVKVITEKSSDTYIVNFQAGDVYNINDKRKKFDNCNVVEGKGNINHIQGNNNTIGDNNTIGNNNTIVSK